MAIDYDKAMRPNLYELMQGGGGGGGYVLPVASADTLGGVKIGEGITIDSEGAISAEGGTPYELPIASTNTLGGVKIGEGITIDSEGTISAEGGTIDAYTKAESDAKYALKTNTYTKAESDDKYALKTSTYTKAEVNEAIDNSIQNAPNYFYINIDSSGWKCIAYLNKDGLAIATLKTTMRFPIQEGLNNNSMYRSATQTIEIPEFEFEDGATYPLSAIETAHIEILNTGYASWAAILSATTNEITFQALSANTRNTTNYTILVTVYGSLY